MYIMKEKFHLRIQITCNPTLFAHFCTCHGYHMYWQGYTVNFIIGILLGLQQKTEGEYIILNYISCILSGDTLHLLLCVNMCNLNIRQ
jgi:hypothetical protein